VSEPRKRQSGGQRTAAERQRARTARLAAEGLKPVRVIVPVDREAEIKQVAEQMREGKGKK